MLMKTPGYFDSRQQQGGKMQEYDEKFELVLTQGSILLNIPLSFFLLVWNIAHICMCVCSATLRYNKLADQKANHLCMFCDEPFTPSHQLKRKKSRLLVLELDKDDDGEVNDE
ncbi:transmembrane protein, putative [Medicago truncatula]|uniref:Transmembrane protein, putative n=1 Tax=Medicago truncatula TaxID=3880 RepID=G7K8I5_MEDTR|nr:transmembrane protein, putative [Medicago truncatula]